MQELPKLLQFILKSTFANVFAIYPVVVEKRQTPPFLKQPERSCLHEQDMNFSFVWIFQSTTEQSVNISNFYTHPFH